MPEHVQPASIDHSRIVADIFLVLVKDVAQRIPLGGPLNTKIERVVGVANFVFLPVSCAPAMASVTSLYHLMDRIETSAEQACLLYE